MKNPQNENEKLWENCEQFERLYANYESDHNALAQYCHWNIVVLLYLNIISSIVFYQAVFQTLFPAIHWSSQ